MVPGLSRGRLPAHTWPPKSNCQVARRIRSVRTALIREACTTKGVYATCGQYSTLLTTPLGDGRMYTFECGKIISIKIYYATSSGLLAQQVQSLLLRLGITASLLCYAQGGKGRDQYHVKVSGKSDIERFFQQIGALGQHKVIHQAAIAEFVDERIQSRCPAT